MNDNVLRVKMRAALGKKKITPKARMFEATPGSGDVLTKAMCPNYDRIRTKTRISEPTIKPECLN